MSIYYPCRRHEHDGGFGVLTCREPVGHDGPCWSHSYTGATAMHNACIDRSCPYFQDELVSWAQ